MLGKIRKSWNKFTRTIGDSVADGNDFGPISRKKERDRDTVKLSVATGAALGAATGLAAGTVATMVNDKTESLTQNPIIHPEYLGYNYRTSEDWHWHCWSYDEDFNCTFQTAETDGWYHRYHSRFNEQVVGSYESPQFGNTVSWTPITGAVAGAVGGSLLGLAVGLSTNVLRNAQNKGEDLPRLDPSTRREVADKTSKAVSKGALIGLGTGTLLGGVAGLVEAKKGGTVTREWQSPQTTNEILGYKPKNSYQSTSSSRPADRSGAAANQAVRRDVPIYNDGKIVMRRSSGEFERARFGPITGALAGGAIGAAAGIVGGVAFGLLEKSLARESQS